MPFPITKKHLSILEPDSVVISGDGANALINSLIQKPAITLVELVQGGDVINLSAISVDQDGKVIIKNKAFKDAVAARMAKIVPTSNTTEASFFDTNCSCGKV